MNERDFIVICNGPSMKGFDFDKLKGHHTLAMNSAYREFKRIGFWSKYWINVDERVAVNHADAYAEFLNDGSPVERMYLDHVGAAAVSAKLKPECRDKMYEIRRLSYGGDYWKYQEKKDQESYVAKWSGDEVPRLSGHTYHTDVQETTGGASAQLGILLGYKRIILLGADCNYVEDIEGSYRIPDESRADGGIKRVMKKTPKENPNYWFGDYQIEGDEYHTPNGMTVHIRGWEKLSHYAKMKGVEVINCSMDSRIPFFKKVKFGDIK